MEEGIYVGVIVVLLMVIMYLLYTRKDMDYVMGKTNNIVGKPDDAYYVKDLDSGDKDLVEQALGIKYSKPIC